jgi:hypothetical protein
MVSIETISIAFTGISISLAAFYYINMLRNTKKNQELQLETRQAQLFMNLYETWRDIQFRKQWLELMNLEWADWEDFTEKYLYTGESTLTLSTFQSQMSFFDGKELWLKKG